MLAEMTGSPPIAPEQVEQAYLECLDKGLLIKFLLGLTESQVAFFQRVIKVGKPLELTDPEMYDYGVFQLTGMLQTFWDGKRLLAVVPSEVRKAYSKLDDKVVSVIEVSALLFQYANACANFYGVLNLESFCHVFEALTKQAVPDSRWMKDFVQPIPERDLFRFYEDYIVHKSFETADFKEVEDFIEQTIDNDDYYLPDKEELLSYEFEIHFSWTPQALDLWDFLTEEILVPDLKADELVEGLSELCVRDRPLKEMQQYLFRNGVVPHIEKMEELMHLLADLSNHTRKWINHGFSPAELLANKQAPETKVGRNVPCPCGSGKKYKKCCGKLSV
jgi:hypothetical protein